MEMFFEKIRRESLTKKFTRAKEFFHIIYAFSTNNEKFLNLTLDKRQPCRIGVFLYMHREAHEPTFPDIMKNRTQKARIELQAQSVSRVLSRINIYLSQTLPQGLSD